MTREEFKLFSAGIRGKLMALVRRFPEDSLAPLSAEDVVQDTMVVLWQLMEKGYPVRDPEALSVKIAKNLCVAVYRRKKSGAELPREDICGGYPATERTDASDIMLIRERLSSALTPTQRKYLSMRNDMGLSLDEISARTGHPKSSIKTTISTARRLLLKLLEKEVL